MQISARAIDALKQGSKIEAIKIVREETGMGLKEAKETVERHLDGDPELKTQMREKNARALPSLSTLTIVICILVIVYYFAFDR
jgi:ribosomal protein L7/L12